MKRLTAWILALLLLSGAPAAALAKKNNQMREGVPVWTEETVRQYALDYVEGKSMSRLWGYYDLQIRRYMPMSTYEAMLTELEWMTGGFIDLGTYRSFEEPEQKTKTHVLHLCMEKQDLDMYFTHKDKEDDWEIMAVEFVPAEKQDISDGRDMLVGEAVAAAPKYTESETTVGQPPYLLGGVLTLPEEASPANPVPACVFVHDFGVADRDGTFGATAFFADLAHALGQMGIASLRYDKRTLAPESGLQETVWEEAVEDAILAGRQLAENPSVDAEHIVIVGHGLGAMLAPRIASQAEGLFAAMLMIGGTPKTLLQAQLDEPSAGTAAMSSQEYAELKVIAEELSSMKESKARELTILGRNGYYYWESERYDPIQIIRKLKLPTYIVQGRKDPVISEDEGWRAYSEAIGDGVTYVGFKSFRGLNHLLMNDLSTNENGVPEYSVAASLDTQAGRNLAQWILNLCATDEEE